MESLFRVLTMQRFRIDARYTFGKERFGAGTPDRDGMGSEGVSHALRWRNA